MSWAPLSSLSSSEPRSPLLHWRGSSRRKTAWWPGHGAWPGSSNLVFPLVPVTHILNSPDPDLGRGWAAHWEATVCGPVSSSQGLQAGLCSYCAGLSTAAPAHSITASNDRANVESREHPHRGRPSPYSTGCAPQVTASCATMTSTCRRANRQQEEAGNTGAAGRRREGATPTGEGGTGWSQWQSRKVLAINSPSRGSWHTNDAERGRGAHLASPTVGSPE